MRSTLAALALVYLLPALGAAQPYPPTRPAPVAPPSGPAPASLAPATSVPAADPLGQVIDLRLKQIDQITGDEAARKELRSIYQEARDAISAAEHWAAEAAKFQGVVTGAPAEFARVRRELAELPKEGKPELKGDERAAELERMATACDSELDVARQAADDLEAAAKQRATRRRELGDKATAARQRLAECARDSQAVAGDDRSPVIVAQRMLYLARRQAIEQELRAYDRELAADDATAAALPLVADLAERRVTLLEQRLHALNEAANHLRRAEAEKQAQEAEQAAVHAHPAVRHIAEDNAALADARRRLAGDIEEITLRIEESDKQLDAVKEQFARTKEKVDAVGLTNAIGLLLRKQRESLPSLATARREAAGRATEIRECQFAMLETADRRTTLADLEGRTAELMRGLTAEQCGGDPAGVKRMLRDALERQRNLLDDLSADQRTHFDKLVDLDNGERQRIVAVQRFAEFLDERVLWIASDRLPQWSDLALLRDAAMWLAGPQAWEELAVALGGDLRHSFWGIAALLVAVPLILLHWRATQQLELAGRRATEAGSRALAPTFDALAWSAALALAWPLLLAVVGWRLSAPAAASELCKAVGAGAMAAAQVLLVVNVLAVVCRRGGLGEAHFSWSAKATAALRLHLGWLRLALPALVYLAVAIHAQPNDRWDGALGRLALVAGLCSTAWFVAQALRPSGPVFADWPTTQQGYWTSRMRYVGYGLGVGLPLALAVAAIVGYYYTAQQLSVRLLLSVYVLLGALLLRALAMRWVWLIARKPAAASVPGGDTLAAAAAASPPSKADAPRPADDSDAQSRRLIKYAVGIAAALCIWCVWADVAPALAVLNRVELWRTTVSEAEAPAAAAGDDSGAKEGKGDAASKPVPARAGERTVPVTLAHLLIAVLIAATTLIAVRNLPGLLEMAVLRRLPIDASVRYAVTSLARYGVAVVGMLLACGEIGLGWSKVQWLVAGVSVGLGFGLQEIFANFVSGIIIFFERPIRVGDVITVDGTTGKVVKIRMRATTILDGDRKELIVPNKEFITGRVLNWTLSDAVNRIQLKLSVATGSDPRQVADVLKAAARRHPDVLGDPGPSVSLEKMGGASLEFVLSCFLPTLERRSQITNELYVAAEHALREAGIALDNGQQDINVRSIELSPELVQGLASALPMARPAEKRPGGRKVA